MSQENVAVVTHIIALFNAGDVLAAAEGFHPDAEWRDLSHAPDTPELLVGVEAIVAVTAQYGRPLDGSALRRRFKKARDAAKLRPLRFHDLRHTYGSLLAAAGVDLVTIQSAMGHSALATTGRYLHAKPATEQAAVFTRAFESSPPAEPVSAPAKQ